MAQSKVLEKCCENMKCKEFGYVCAAALGSVMVNQVLAIRVSKARKQYDVKYPRMYHDDPEHVFNCIQRAHQNYIEVHPFFLTMLAIAGVRFPKQAAICGGIFLVGRMAYAAGYSTGNPDKRKWGIVSYLGLLPLFGMSLCNVLHLTGLCKGCRSCC